MIRTFARTSKASEVVSEPGVDQFGNARASVGLEDDVGFLLEARQGVGNGGRESAVFQERMVVLSISDADDLFGREP